MYRRRRRSREIHFSFDSFLDVVANVVGIIIRLILVAWVGARSYHAVAAKQEVEAPPPGPVAARAVAAPPITEPLDPDLEQHRQELANEQQRLLEQLRQCQSLQTDNTQAAQQLTAVAAAQSAVAQQRGQLEQSAAAKAGAAQSAQWSLADLKRRSEQLALDLRELEKLPPLTKTLRYRTPVSRPVASEELHFECREGRVSFIDLQAFLVEIRRGLEDKAQRLKTQWEVEDTAGPVGAFRLRYTVEREAGLLRGGVPDSAANFRYGVSSWVVEPILPVRGENAAAALAAGSAFRRLIDSLDPEHTVVTFWVYPDSFALYRQLRDLLHERNIEVAGRPLPTGVAIASSRQGTASRGQ
jgi:hypothetical protein